MHDLGRTPADGPKARVAPGALGRELAHVAVAAVNLDALVGDLPVQAKPGVVKAVLYDCFHGGKAELRAEVLTTAADRFARATTGPLDGRTVRSPANAVVACLRAFLTYEEQDPYSFRPLFTAPAGGAAASARVSAARNRAIGELARRTPFVLTVLGRTVVPGKA